MATNYPFGSMSYVQYLQANSFVRDVTDATAAASEELRWAISDQTSEIVASNEALSREFGRGLDRLNRTFAWGFDSVRSSIEELNATFSYNMGLVVAQLQTENQLHLGVIERLDAIHKTLESPTLTQAREFYRAGCERLARGLLDKALEAFLKSEAKNDTDFLTQLQLGRLYLYGKDEDDDVVDLEKALRHLMLAARFSKAEISFLPEAAASAGEALAHAAITCFLLAGEAQLAGDAPAACLRLEESVRLALQAAALRPRLGLAHYQAASGLALLGKTEESVKCLQGAIETDGKYGLRVIDDPSFAGMREVVLACLKRLRDQFLSRAKDLLASKRREVDSHGYVGDLAQSVRRGFDAELAESERMIAGNTLLDGWGAVSTLARLSVKAGCLACRLDLVDHIQPFKGGYKDLKFMPDGSLLALVGDNSVTLWDACRQLELARSPEQKVGGYGAAFSPDGALCATGSSDNLLRLWDVPSFRHLATLTDHGGKDTQVAFICDGRLLASVGPDGVNLWDVEKRCEVGALAVQSFCFGRVSPDGALVATGGPDGVELWSIAQRSMLGVLKGPAGRVTHLAFSPDGSLLAGDCGTAVVVWDVASRREFAILSGHSKSIVCVAFSPDGSLLASGSFDRSLRLWDLAGHREVASAQYPTDVPVAAPNFITFSLDGSLLAEWQGVWQVQYDGVLSPEVWDRRRFAEEQAAAAARERDLRPREAVEAQERQQAREQAERQERLARDRAEEAHRRDKTMSGRMKKKNGEDYTTQEIGAILQKHNASLQVIYRRFGPIFIGEERMLARKWLISSSGTLYDDVFNTGGGDDLCLILTALATWILDCCRSCYYDQPRTDECIAVLLKSVNVWVWATDEAGRAARTDAIMPWVFRHNAMNHFVFAPT